jgi:hypothetical protein
MTDPSPDALEAVAARVRAALAGQVPAEAQEAAGPITGTAAGGLITAQLDPDGSLRALTLEAEVFDRPLVDVAAAARTAINAALDARPGRVDVAPIIAQVRAAQSEARRSLSTVTAAMADIESNVRAARGGNR